MPLAHNLNKVTKNLSKSTGSIHIKGRKFKQLNRATLRDQKLTARKAKAHEQREKEVQDFKFIQEAINNRKEQETFTLDEMKLFIESFLSRYDEELTRLRKERRPGRPATSRQQILEEKVKYDEQIYKTGYRIPDLSDKDTVEKLKNWNGSSGGLTIMKFIRVSKDMKQLPTKDIEMQQ